MEETVLDIARLNTHSVAEGVWMIDEIISQELGANLYRQAMELKSGWVDYRHFMERKSAFQSWEELPPAWQQVLSELSSNEFIDFLSQLSGIDHLVFDPQLIGSGIHRMGRGDYLAVHRDFTHHPSKKLQRRLNLIIHLSPVWKEDWQGHTQFYDEADQPPSLNLRPSFCQALVFKNDAFKYHGVPDCIDCPEGVHRLTLSTFYYAPEPVKTRKKYTYYPPFQFSGMKMRSLAFAENLMITIYSFVTAKNRARLDKMVGSVMKKLFS